MPSIRKRVVSFIRQLSHPHSSSQKPLPPPPSCFIQRYLFGDEHRREQPTIEHSCGSACQELPVRHMGHLSPVVFAACTGPDGGLTTVNCAAAQKHVSTSDPDVEFIDDSRRSSNSSLRTTQLSSLSRSVDNSMMNIRVMGLTYCINEADQGKKSVHTSISDLNEYILDVESNYPILPPPEEYIDVPEEEMSYLRYTCSAPASPFHQSPEPMTFQTAALRNIEVAGVKDWFRPHPRAYGAATSLYERHPVTRQNAGDPIADSFAVVARENSAILVLADGVNWGEKAKLASRSAVHGCVEYLNKVLYIDSFRSPARARPKNTSDVFLALLRSFHMAHSMILQEGGMLTTLTAAVVLPLQEDDQFVVCVCNVGDSLAYVYSPMHGVREITQGSHDINSMRDMRDALGALGPVDGLNPELSNLTCSMTEVQSGDIVFITSDGVSDNFDPVVGKFAIPKRTSMSSPPLSRRHPKELTGLPGSASAGNILDGVCSRPAPFVEAHQRHELTLMRMEDLLNHGLTGSEPPCRTAQQLCVQLIDFASKLTVAKRRILEDPDLYVDESSEHDKLELKRNEQRCRRRKVFERLAMVPGKLDHASVVAYTVGDFQLC